MTELKYPILRNRTWMRDRYLVDGLEVSEIAKLVGCNPMSVKQWLIRLELYNPMDHWTPVQYTAEDLLAAASRVSSGRQLEQELGIVRVTIEYNAYRVGLNWQSLKDQFQKPVSREMRKVMEVRERERARLAHRDRVMRMYTEEGMTIHEIGDEIGLDPSGVYRLLQRCGVQTRRKALLEADEQLRQQVMGLIGDGLTVREAAQRLGLPRRPLYPKVARWKQQAAEAAGGEPAGGRG